MYVYYIANPSQSPSLTFKGAIAYSWVAPPRRVNQPGTGTTLDPSDGRIDWAVSQLDGRLWFAHGAGIGGFPTVNWGWVNPGSMTIRVSTASATEPRSRHRLLTAYRAAPCCTSGKASPIAPRSSVWIDWPKDRSD